MNEITNESHDRSRPPDHRPEVEDLLDADPRLRKVKEYLETDLSRNLTLSRAAEIAQLTTTYFSDYFRRKTGVRFMQWVRSVRIRKAVELLATSDQLIRSVCSAVGYRDLRTFERAFRRQMKMSPRDYKKRFFGDRVTTRAESRVVPDRRPASISESPLDAA